MVAEAGRDSDPTAGYHAAPARVKDRCGAEASARRSDSRRASHAGPEDPWHTPAMVYPMCVKCSKPILPAETTSTEEQVDACTLVVQRVPYHAACRDEKSRDAA